MAEALYSRTGSSSSAGAPPPPPLCPPSPLHPHWRRSGAFSVFRGLPFIIWAPKQMLGTEPPPRRICWWKWGSAICLILGHYQVKGGWGRCSWNITAAVNLLLSYCYCQLRSYYSLIESSPRRWWVEINLSIIVKGLWQSEPHSWKTPSHTNSACYIYVQPIFDLGGHILRNARGGAVLGKAGCR